MKGAYLLQRYKCGRWYTIAAHNSMAVVASRLYTVRKHHPKREYRIWTINSIL